jgi:DNA-binding beta-propeller fold protein YncE
MKNLKAHTLILFLFLFLFINISCEKNNSPSVLTPVAENVQGDGVFILNEGNFMKGNGSLSFYSYEKGQIFNDLFYQANNRFLGDVPYSMIIRGDNGYIVVNNSGNIEVINKNTIEVIKTISGFISPRNILPVNNVKAYVSSLYSNSLSVIDLLTNSISGSINLRRTSEAMVLSGNEAFVSYWSAGKEIMVINTANDLVIDSIQVAPEPESMVLDKNNKLWILCSGGYTGQALAELISVNTTTHAIEKRLVFASKTSYPSGLQINGTKDTLYYVDNGIWKMSIESSVLPAVPFRVAGNRSIYKIGVDQRNKRLFFTNVMDYQQKGYVLQLNSGGKLIDSCRSDIIPGSFCFK